MREEEFKPKIVSASPREVRGRGVTAAHRPFKPGGGGSNPSGPIALILRADSIAH